MSSTTSNVISTPYPSSLLAKTGTHSRDAITATTAAKTAQLWDEYERIALENERRRNNTPKTLAPRRRLSFDFSESYGSHRRTTKKSSRSDSNTKFKGLRMASSSKSLVSCRNCKQIIPFTSQTCQGCQRSDLPRPRREATPISGSPVTTSAVTAPSKAQEKPSSTTPVDQAAYHAPTSRPQTGQQTPTEPSRSRKTSLTDPNEAFLRIQMTSPQTYNAPHFQTHANSPSITSASSLHPSAPYSRGSTRPSSFANRYSYHHHNNSATPSEMSTLYTCALTQATSPLSLSSVDYALQNIKSAWDDWDSEDENNKTNEQQQRKKSSERVKSSGSWIARPKSSKSSTPKGATTPTRTTTREGKVIERIDSVVTLTVPRRRKVKAKQTEDERLEQARRETREQIKATKMKMQQQQPLLHQQKQSVKRQQAQQQRQLMNRQQLQVQKQQRQQIQLQKGPTSSKGFFRLISCGCVKNI